MLVPQRTPAPPGEGEGQRAARTLAPTWAFGPTPGTRILALWCNRDDYKRFLLDGFAWFDGQHSRVDYDISEWVADAGIGFVRFTLSEPFRMPPTVLRFEDMMVAQAILETGWYTLDGALCRATQGESPGEVRLDRVYHDPPTPTYEGRDIEAIGDERSTA